MKRPCTCDKAQCRLCTLFHQSPAYRTLWSDDQGEGGTSTTPTPGRLLTKRPLPCVYLGKVLLRRECNCRRDDVRECSTHGKVSQNGYCEICEDYDPEG